MRHSQWQYLRDSNSAAWTIDIINYVTGIRNGDDYHLSRVLSLLRRKLLKHYGTDAIGARMASPSGTSSFVLVAVNATMENSSLKTGSEVAALAYEAAETLWVLCENETNEVYPTKSSHSCFRWNWKEPCLQVLHLRFTKAAPNEMIVSRPSPAPLSTAAYLSPLRHYFIIIRHYVPFSLLWFQYWS